VDTLTAAMLVAHSLPSPAPRLRHPTHRSHHHTTTISTGASARTRSRSSSTSSATP
jgi:hypothetical protein